MSLKEIILPLGIFFGGCLAVSAVVLAKPKPAPRPASGEAALVSVEVFKAQSKSERLSVKAQGTVVPRREISIVAQVSGQVIEVGDSFADGGFFQKDQLLLQLDTRDYQTALMSSKAKLAEAKRKLAEEHGLSRQAKREWRDLGNANANDLFIRKPQLASAEAALDFAEADVAQSQLNLTRTKILSPFDQGRIKETLVDLGQYVTAGTRLANVYDSSVVEVRVALTEQQAALVELPFMDTQSASVSNVIISGSVAGMSHQWTGHIARTDALIDPKTRMFYAIIEVADPFANPNAPLLPGLFVDVEIQGKQLPKVFTLPRAAIYERNNVYVIDESNHVKAQSVNILKKTAEQVWLQGEISDGALISLEKQSLTPIGSEVSPVIPSQKIVDNNPPIKAAMVAP